MPVPLLVPLAFLAATAIGVGWDIYSTQKTTEVNDAYNEYLNAYYSAAAKENDRYWSDYIRRHHLDGRTIKYPYRTGFNYDMGKIYSSESALVRNSYARAGSYVYGGSSLVKSGSYGFSRSGYARQNRRR